jgi:hypothetical protein
MDILCDIDGTLADARHRLHHVQKEPKDWDAFFNACPGDSCIRVMANVVKALQVDHRIIFVTGRPERIRQKTIDWLGIHGLLIEGQAHMLMRKDEDHQPDWMLKEQMLKLLRTHGYKPRLAIEDRKQVVEMYRKRGLIVLQCAEGDY